MTQAEILAVFRADTGDKQLPYQADDSKVLLWLSEAEREGAERGLYLRTDMLDDIFLIAEQATYEISSDIFQLDSLMLDSSTLSLKKTSREIAYKCGYSSFPCSALSLHYFIENESLTLVPAPKSEGILHVFGRRYPRETLETPVHLHEKLIFWLLHRFYSMRDSDIYAPELAASNLQLFEAAFGKKKPAWLMQTQKEAPAINHFHSGF